MTTSRGSQDGPGLRAGPAEAERRARLVRAVFEEGWNEGRYDRLEGHLAPVAAFLYHGRSFRLGPQDLPAAVA